MRITSDEIESGVCVSKIELPIVPHHQMNTYLHLTHPFAVILSQPKVLPWMYEQFINIYLTGDESFIYTGHEFELTGKEMFTYTEFRKATWDYDIAIIPYACRQLSQGFYLYIWMDEYYLPGQSAYQKTHFRHVSLFYGYDDE